MKIVLLSGGSGKRLWPLSNTIRSKQFLKMLPNEVGGYESMLQRVYRQLVNLGYERNIIVCANVFQYDYIRNQIGEEVSVIQEPFKRDTYPAILLSAAYLYSIEQIEEDETVVFLPVDSFVEQFFYQIIEQFDNTFIKLKEKYLLVGIKPTVPSSKYGYLLPDEGYETITQIKKFIEKPSRKVARQLIEEGALWNSGIFACKLRTILDYMGERNVPLDYESIFKDFEAFPKTSWEYEVFENEKSMAMISSNESWKDIGAWDTLTQVLTYETAGEIAGYLQNKNTHVINELSIPIAVVGVENIIIAASDDGILVCSKKEASKVKEAISGADKRPRIEERHWGYYKILDYHKIGDAREVLTKKMIISEGKNLSYHYHLKRQEVWTIVRGIGIFIYNGKITRVETGDVLKIPNESLHTIKAIEELEIIEVQIGEIVTEKDIVRLANSWDEILEVLNTNVLRRTF